MEIVSRNAFKPPNKIKIPSCLFFKVLYFEKAGRGEWLFLKLIDNDLPVTERIMTCTDSKIQNKFTCMMSVVRFTSLYCGNHVGQDSFGLQTMENQ